jgi:hypothetical protein
MKLNGFSLTDGSMNRLLRCLVLLQQLDKKHFGTFFARLLIEKTSLSNFISRHTEK